MGSPKVLMGQGKQDSDDLLRDTLDLLILKTLSRGPSLLLAFAALRWIVPARQDLPEIDAVHIDASILLFALTITILSGIFSGSIPALSAVRGTLSSLQENSRSLTGGRSRTRLRKVLLAAEIALTVVLLIGAGLLLKSFAALRTVEMGCETLSHKPDWSIAPRFDSFRP
jgi:hypothetical protein